MLSRKLFTSFKTILSTSYCLLTNLIRTFEFACVDDEHLQAVLDVRETGIRVVVEAQNLHVRTTFLHSLREASATDVVCTASTASLLCSRLHALQTTSVAEASRRLHNNEAVDAVLGVVKDFCLDEPAFARVVRRVDNAVDVVL